MNSNITLLDTLSSHSFRPQQGVTIMNNEDDFYGNYSRIGFRPQQGLTIMNKQHDNKRRIRQEMGFRPQQG